MVGEEDDQRQRPHDVDRVAVEQRHARAELTEVDDELGRHPTRRSARQHEHGMPLVGQPLDHDTCRDGVDVVEGRRDVRLLDVGVELHVVETVSLALLPYPLSGGAQLAADVTLHRFLQAHEALVAQLVRQTHDGCCPGIGRRSKIGDRSEADDLRVVEDHRRDPTLGRGELRASLADPVGDAHRPLTIAELRNPTIDSVPVDLIIWNDHSIPVHPCH